MSQGGPRPSAWYVERSNGTRVPATPAALSDKSSNFAYGKNDPGAGNTNPGDGLVLAGLMSIVVSVWPGDSQTLSNAGDLFCWLYNPYLARWARCPDLDIAMPTGGTLQAWSSGAYQNVSRLGMLINWLPSGVTSTASDILVRLDGFSSVGGQAI